MIADLLHNPIYKGCATVASRHGTVERPGGGLVDADTWDRVQAALAQNKKMSKRNARHWPSWIIRASLVFWTAAQQTWAVLSL